MKKFFVIALLLVCSNFVYGQKKAQGLVAKLTAHSVSLTCNPPTTGTPPTGYFFYRGTTAGGENPTPLNASFVTTCAYTDTAVTPLSSYFYTAKSYSSTSAPPGLSTASNEVQATIPGDPVPNPPGGLTATSQ